MRDSDFTGPEFIPSPSPKTVLIAGGAGFVGSALCDRILQSGNSVLCVDNLQTGSMANIRHLIGHPDFRFLRQDILYLHTVSGPVDEIYNLACAASPPQYQKDPVHTFRTCTEGVLNLLELAERKGARILQSSISEVYGDPEVRLQNENYRGCVNTVGPRACYDEGKRAAETLFWEYGTHRGTQTRIARIFNTYGPRMDPQDGRVVSNFVVQALLGQDLTVYGDGTQTRSFCFVDDLVEGLVRLMASDEQMPVNLGNPGEFTMLQLAELVRAKVCARTGGDVDLVFRPLPQDDPRQRRPDISRAARLLGWVPEVPLADGLDRVVDWFARRLAAPSQWRLGAVAR